jgi:hypothetical protein
MRVSSPISADINIHNDALVLEMRPDIARRAGKVRHRGRPRTRIRRLAGDVGRHASPSELPYANALVPPLEGHDPPAIGVEAVSERRRRSTDGAAGRVTAVTWTVALLARRAGLDALDVLHGAVGGRVQRHLIPGGGLVDGFHNVDFAVSWPDVVVAVGQPQGRPRCAAARRALDVEDEETLVVGRLRLYSHREPAIRGVGNSGVYSEKGRVCGCVGEVLLASQ